MLLQKLKFLIVAFILANSVQDSLQSQNEKELFNHLLDLYNTLERPIRSDSDPVIISLGLTLLQILHVDEHNSLLITNSWLTLEWVDMNLEWKPEEFGNITTVRIPPHRVWKPDILLYNSVDKFFDATVATNLVVNNNGSVSFIPPGIFKSSCKMDMSLYPYDEQKCEMKFGSWTYDEYKVDMQMNFDEGADLGSLRTHELWEVVKIPVRRNSVVYPCCSKPFVDITFTVHLRRRGEAVIKILMLPFAFITTTSLIGFLLPPTSKAKLFLNTLALFFILHYKYCVPAVISTTPFLIKYFASLIIVVLSALFLAIAILSFIENSKNGRKMPQWVKFTFLKFLPIILFVNIQKSTIKNAASKRENEMHSLKIINGNSELRDFYNEIVITNDKVRSCDVKIEAAKNWMDAAKALNRLSLILLIIVTAISTSTILV